MRRANAAPAFLRRIGYDSSTEEAALEAAARGDFDRCRLALHALVEGLRPQQVDGEWRIVAHLLLDVLHRVNRRLVRDESDHSRCQEQRLELIDAFSRCQDLEAARGRFELALTTLLAPPARAETPVHPLVRRAKNDIDARYQQRLSLSSIAERLAVSPNYLSRLFRRETGSTLTHYLQRVRLRHAQNLMLEGQQTCAEIAYRVGFQNYRDFYRNVVKYEKTSPRELRRRLSRQGSATAENPAG